MPVYARKDIRKTQRRTKSLFKSLSDGNITPRISRSYKFKCYLFILQAANYLYENNATYPIKLNHSNPTTLSVEALEVFYRINASIIKFLEHEKEVARTNGDLFNKVLKNLSNSPFAYNKAKVDGKSHIFPFLTEKWAKLYCS